MTDKQREIFSEILDLNWECNREKNPTEKFNLVKKLGEKKNELRNDMGSEAYDKFMSMGAKMFS